MDAGGSEHPIPNGPAGRGGLLYNTKSFTLHRATTPVFDAMLTALIIPDCGMKTIPAKEVTLSASRFTESSAVGWRGF